MSEQQAIESMLDEILSDRCTFEVVQKAEVDGWAPSLWSVLTEAGVPGISLPEDLGGVGGDLDDVLAALRVLGRYAAPVPVAESAMLGGWLLSSAGLRLSDGVTTVAEPRHTSIEVSENADGLCLNGWIRRVPWGRVADSIAVVKHVSGELLVLDLPREELNISLHANLAGEPRDDFRLADIVVPSDRVRPAPPGVTVEQLELRGALARVSLMAGAIRGVSELTIEYANNRTQFGRSIAQFQAVGQMLAQIVSASASSQITAEVAAQHFVRTNQSSRVAMAKIAAGEAANTVASLSHQVHGAMGMTREYRLHHLTRRLWTWREEWGSDRAWSLRLGSEIARGGPSELYPTITS